MTPAERAQAIAATARDAREKAAAENRLKYPELYEFVRVFGAKVRRPYVVGSQEDPQR